MATAIFIGMTVAAHALHGACQGTGGQSTGNLTGSPWSSISWRVSNTTLPTTVALCYDLVDPSPTGGCATGAQCGYVAATFAEPATGLVGVTVAAGGGTTPTPLPALNPTGASVGVPAVTSDPFGGGTTGARVATTDTCAFVNGTATPSGCTGVLLGQVIIAEGDLPTIHDNAVWVGQDTTRNTVTVVPPVGSPVPVNVPQECVRYLNFTTCGS